MKTASAFYQTVFAVLTLLCAPRFTNAATYSNDQTAKAGETISPQHYRVYVPDGVAKVRAVIIHQHGCGRGDWNTAWDVHWRALADKWDAALVAPHLEGDCGVWYRPSNGTLRAYTDAMKAIGEQSGHSELPTVPLVLWGHSGGGDWVAQMMKDQPTRVVAAVSRSGGNDPGTAADGIPTLLVRGSDSDIGSDVRSWFNKVRPRGALVALARDLDQWHETADLRVLAIPFFDAALRLRLPPAGGSGTTLRAINAAEGWLGDATTFAVTSSSAFAGDKMKANWLVDEANARRWSEFANPKSAHGTGWATDTSAPDSKPWDVSAAVSQSTVTLSFRARADLETGIKAFAIYRDGTRVSMLGGKAGTSNMGGGFFQWGAFGDESEPGPAMPTTPSLWPFPASAKDENVPNGAHSYAVATINGQGMEGPKSVAVPVFVGTNTDAVAPMVSIKAPAKVDSGKTGSHTAAVASIEISGAASDNQAVKAVVWSNDRGGSDTANGTTDWTASVPLFGGTNTLRVTAYDEAGNATTTTLVVTTSATPTPGMGGAGGSAMMMGGAGGTSQSSGSGGAGGVASANGGASAGGTGNGGSGGAGGATNSAGGAAGEGRDADSGGSCSLGTRRKASDFTLIVMCAALIWAVRRRIGKRASRH